jgi:rubrerythrin
MSQDRSRGEGVSGQVGEGSVGGEPVCLMHRLCPACGRPADEDPPTRCPHCDTAIEEQ